jgi:hypothetical protein
VAGKKKKKFAVAGVDMGLLEKRSFVRRAERVRRQVEEREKKAAGVGDVWESGLVEEVEAGKSKVRRAVEQKLNVAVRGSAAVLRPDDGESVNPLFEAHQDALGEAVAVEVAKQDQARWEADQLSFDPKVLLDRELHVAEDFSEDDKGEEAGDGAMTDAADVVVSRLGGQERRTRRDKNRASRRRTFEAQRVRKATHAHIAEQIADLEALDAAAAAEATRLAGSAAAAAKAAAAAAVVADGVDEAEARPLHAALGGVRVPTERDLRAVPLSGDLAGELRGVGMAVVNPLVKDRFLAFQRRGMIEPPLVIVKERKQATRDRLREEQRDKMVRKGRGSRSNMTYWRKPRKR